jgi:hypothetical protein
MVANSNAGGADASTPPGLTNLLRRALSASGTGATARTATALRTCIELGLGYGAITVAVPSAENGVRVEAAATWTASARTAATTATWTAARTGTTTRWQP